MIAEPLKIGNEVEQAEYLPAVITGKLAGAGLDKVASEGILKTVRFVLHLKNLVKACFTVFSEQSCRSADSIP